MNKFPEVRKCSPDRRSCRGALEQISPIREEQFSPDPPMNAQITEPSLQFDSEFQRERERDTNSDQGIRPLIPGDRINAENALRRKMSFDPTLVSRYSRLSRKRHSDLIRSRANSCVGPVVRIISASHVDLEDEQFIQERLQQDYFAEVSVESELADSVNVPIIIYKRRFYILFIFSFLMWFTCMQWSTWGPISDSMFAVFPDWNTSTVAMMENWVTFMFVCCVLPVCWLTERIGLRSGILLSSMLFFTGLALRCITDKSPTFTIMCHVCAILLGMSITLVLAAPPMIAALWFPPNERTTVVALIMAVGQLGSVGSYLEPLVVREPVADVPTSLIKWDIMSLMYAVAGMSALLFLAILIYFPSKPPHPPSITSSTERLYFKESLRFLLRKKNFLAITFIYGFATGPSLGWIGLLNFSLEPLGFSQSDVMFIGLVAACSCFVMAVTAGRLTDLAYGYVKETIIGLLIAASFSYYWFLLLTTNAISFTRWQVYVSVSLGLSLNYATIALFYELAVEAAFPVPEVLIGGIITASDSLFTTMFFFVYFFKDIGFGWISYTLIASNALPVLLLLFIKTDYSRYNLDSPKPQDSSDDQP